MGDRLAGDGVENPKSTWVLNSRAGRWGFPTPPPALNWGQLKTSRTYRGAELEGWVPGRFNLPPCYDGGFLDLLFTWGEDPPHPPRLGMKTKKGSGDS